MRQGTIDGDSIHEPLFCCCPVSVYWKAAEWMSAFWTGGFNIWNSLIWIKSNSDKWARTGHAAVEVRDVEIAKSLMRGMMSGNLEGNETFEDGNLEGPQEQNTAGQNAQTPRWNFPPSFLESRNCQQIFSLVPMTEIYIFCLPDWFGLGVIKTFLHCVLLNLDLFDERSIQSHQLYSAWV